MVVRSVRSPRNCLCWLFESVANLPTAWALSQYHIRANNNKNAEVQYVVSVRSWSRLLICSYVSHLWYIIKKKKSQDQAIVLDWWVGVKAFCGVWEGSCFEMWHVRAGAMGTQACHPSCPRVILFNLFAFDHWGTKAKASHGLMEHTIRKDTRCPVGLEGQEGQRVSGKKRKKARILESPWDPEEGSKNAIACRDEEDRCIVRESESDGKPIGMPSRYKEDLCLHVWAQVMLKLSGSHTHQNSTQDHPYMEKWSN